MNSVILQCQYCGEEIEIQNPDDKIDTIIPCPKCELTNKLMVEDDEVGSWFVLVKP